MNGIILKITPAISHDPVLRIYIHICSQKVGSWIRSVAYCGLYILMKMGHCRIIVGWLTECWFLLLLTTWASYIARLCTTYIRYVYMYRQALVWGKLTQDISPKLILAAIATGVMLLLPLWRATRVNRKSGEGRKRYLNRTEPTKCWKTKNGSFVVLQGTKNMIHCLI